jgi:mono/diheme cytochrome c family protein
MRRPNETVTFASACALAGVVLLASQVLAQPQPVGRDLYLHTCADCHQADMAGVPGDYPSLVHDPIANGPADVAARVVLEGTGAMPNFDAQLTDSQIAAILTYVRSSSGNNAGPVAPAVVAQVRDALAHGH